MSSNEYGTLSLVPNDIDDNEKNLSSIITKIKEDTWETVIHDFDLNYFLTEITPGEWTIDHEHSWQVRNKNINRDKVDRLVNQVDKANPGDKSKYLKKPLMVFFPEPSEYEGQEIRANNYMLLDDHHGVLIKRMCGYEKWDCYSLNFKDDLNSKFSNMRAVGNGLNKVVEEQEPCENEDLKIEFYEWMDENLKDGEQVPQAYKDAFLKRNPQITSGTIANWIAWEKNFGGRKSATRMWSGAELDEEQKYFADQYPNHIVFTHTLWGFDGPIVGMAIKSCMKKKTNKVLTILNATNSTQEKGIELNEGAYSRDTVLKYYQKIAANIFTPWGALTIDVIFLDNKSKKHWKNGVLTSHNAKVTVPTTSKITVNG